MHIARGHLATVDGEPHVRQSPAANWGVGFPLLRLCSLVMVFLGHDPTVIPCPTCAAVSEATDHGRLPGVTGRHPEHATADAGVWEADAMRDLPEQDEPGCGVGRCREGVEQPNVRGGLSTTRQVRSCAWELPRAWPHASVAGVCPRRKHRAPFAHAARTGPR